MCYKNSVFAVRSKLLLSKGAFLIVILSVAKDLIQNVFTVIRSPVILSEAKNLLRRTGWGSRSFAAFRMTIRSLRMTNVQDDNQVAQDDRKGSADGDGYPGVGATIIEEPLPFIVDKAFDKDCPCRILSAFLE